jgi:hypothetical protein
VTVPVRLTVEIDAKILDELLTLRDQVSDLKTQLGWYRTRRLVLGHKDTIEALEGVVGELKRLGAGPESDD